ncbi:hypothetical protein [Almyronema epifaneia]|uniref:DUF4384 domain-containing protein n=1 Tax=Almyronema epifaneia S1 TaxID=2991925 RepID=A0ABW6IE97_9CYAN
MDQIIKVICAVQDDATKPPFAEEARGDVSIAEFQEASALRFGLRDLAIYKFVLERNGCYLRILDNTKTFESEQIQSGDRLIFCRFEHLPDSVFFPGDLVMYTLTLLIPNISPNPQYFIYLNEPCERNPEAVYFANPITNGRLKFDNFLKDKLQQQVSVAAIDRLIEEWCKEIELGHPATTLRLKR